MKKTLILATTLVFATLANAQHSYIPTQAEIDAPRTLVPGQEWKLHLGGPLYQGNSTPQRTTFVIPAKVITKTVYVNVPVDVKPPTIQNPSKNWEINTLQFSNSASLHKVNKNGDNYEDFLVGETATIKLRHRNLSKNRDEKPRWNEVTWDKNTGRFEDTGEAVATYTSLGFRIYAQDGWFIIQHKDGPHAQFRISKKPHTVNGRDVLFEVGGEDTNRITLNEQSNQICFKIGNQTNTPPDGTCISYNINWKYVK